MQTAVFDLAHKQGYRTQKALAKAMGISTTQLWRIHNGRRFITSRFIEGARRAFPGKTLDELFPADPVTDEVA